MASNAVDNAKEEQAALDSVDVSSGESPASVPPRFKGKLITVLLPRFKRKLNRGENF